MNKVYKLVWSKIRNCWIVVSEIAKSHSKSAQNNFVDKRMLDNKICLQLQSGIFNSAIAKNNIGFVLDANIYNSAIVDRLVISDFKITVAAIVKNEAKNVPQWVKSARSCADEIVVVDTGSTDGTVERFADYGIKCYHYDWNDDFASAKNYMISLCHSDWIVLLDGDEWFRDGCDVRKAIAKHHNNPVEKAIIADWICLDTTRDNTIMFSGGAVRAFRNSPEIRYFRKVHENLTLNYENFVFEPDFKMYHTGYSGDVNRSKHERNLRIMRTMFDFDNGKVELPADWRYIQDTYAGLGELEKSLEASDKMLEFDIPELLASSWITRFNVLFQMKVSMERMEKEFDHCFKTVPSVSGFRFLASIFYMVNDKPKKAMDEYCEGIRMLMGVQDRVALENSFWRMYLPKASALISSAFMQIGNVESALTACFVSEFYCGKNELTNIALADIYSVVNKKQRKSFKLSLDKVYPLLSCAKEGLFVAAAVSGVFISSFALPTNVLAACGTLGGENNTTSVCYSYEKDGSYYWVAPSCVSNTVTVNGVTYTVTKHTPQNSAVVGGVYNNSSGTDTVVVGGGQNHATGIQASVFGGTYNDAVGTNGTVVGGEYNTAGSMTSSNGNGRSATVVGGSFGKATGSFSVQLGGSHSEAKGDYAISIGSAHSYATCSIAIMGTTGTSTCANTAKYSVAIGLGSLTTKNYEIAIGSSTAPITLGGNMTVTGTNTVTDGTTSKRWSDILQAGSYTLPTATSSVLGGVKTGSNITNSSGTISLTKANVVSALGYTPPEQDTNTHYTSHIYVGSGTAANAATTNGNTKIALADDSTVRNTLTIKGTGKTTVTSDANGVITINSTDANTTYSAMSADELNTGTATTSRAMTAKVVSDYVKSKTDDKITGLSVSGKTITYTKGDGSTGTITTQDTNTTYNAFTGASALAAGTTGLVTAPAKGQQGYVLHGDGTWSADKDTTYSTGTASASGLTKLYTGTGTNTDGTMTQSAINTALGGKFNTTGGTLTGGVTISSATPSLTEKNTGLTRGTAPTAANSKWLIQSIDSASKATGGIYKTVSTSNVSEMRLYDYTNADNTSGGHYIGVGHKADGTAFTYAPTPTASSNTTEIATTAFVKTEGRITADGQFAKKANSVATNITALDTAAKNAIKGLSVSGATITYTKGDGTTGTITTQDTNTTYSAFTGATSSAAGGAGLVKAPAAGDQAKFLRGDGTWAADNDTHWTSHIYVGSGTAANAATTNGNTKIALADNSTVRNTLTIKGTGATSVTSDANGVITISSSDANTTYSNMTAATASAAGTAGLVPAPAAGKQNAFLRGDGTWVVPTDTNTHYTSHMYVGSGTAANAATTNGNTKIALADDSTVRNTLTIKGTGSTSVTSDANGVITISSTDNNTTYSAMGADELTTGTATTGRVMTAKVVSDYVKSKTNDKITSLSVSGKVITYTKGDGTTGTITTQDTNTTYGNMGAASASAAGTAGLVPAPAKGAQNYVLHGDGTWKADANTTYSAFTGATASAAGGAGLVKAPAAGDQNKFLRGDGTWAVDNNTTYAAMDASELSTGTATTSRTMTAKVVSDYVKSKTDDKLTGLSVSGKTITYTKGDGTTGTITTQDNDTTYGAGTTALLNTGTDTTNKVWTSKALADYVKGESRITADGTFAKKANTAAANITALDTAAKNAIKSLSVSGKVITYTKGDGTTGTITTQDTNTTYNAFTGATASVAGTTGLVTAPAKGQQGYVLHGDGTWSADKDTTYSALSASELTTGTATTARSVTAKVLNDYVKSKTDDKITGLSVNGKVITYTKGDGTTGTITTQDTNTTYSAMGADELSTGTATTGRTVTAKVVSDYVKSKTDDKISNLSVNGNTITYTKGNGTTGSFNLQDTTYTTGNASVLNTGTETAGKLWSGKVLSDYVVGKVNTEANTRSTADTALDNRIGTLSSNGYYIKKSATNNMAANLTLLDYHLKATNDNITGFASDITRNKNNIATLNTSVSSALSSVGAASSVIDLLSNTKADASLANLNASGKRVIANAAINAVQEYMASQNGTATPTVPMMYVNNSNTLAVNDAGNGSLHVGEGSYVNGTSSIAIGVGNQVNANNAGAFGDPSIINADASYVLGNDDTVNTGAVGSFVVGNDSVSSAKGGLTFGSNNVLSEISENSIALGNNITVNGKNSVALGSNSIAVDDNVVSVGNNTLQRKIVNVLAGDVSENSNEVVTGSQLFSTNERVKANEDAITQKADLDASNIDVDSWTAKLGVGTVEENNTGLINGGTVFNAIQQIKDNSLIQQNGDILSIGNTIGGSTIDVSNNLGDGRIITGVVTDPDNPYSATNVGYVQSVSENIVNAVNNSFTKMNDKVNKLGANASALAALTPASFEGDEKWSLAASVGHYHGETGGAVGAFYKPTENVMMNIRMAGGNGENMAAAGVAVSLSKGDIPGVTKRQLASEVISLKQNQVRYEQKIAQQDEVIKDLVRRLEAVENK